jgi:Zn-dependent peptidase ImmA (M78 family)
MSKHVPYLADDVIERDAELLIGEYEHARGMPIELPIPIEDIVEKHLKLRIDFDDMHARCNIPRTPSGQPDILGAIYGDGCIFIDESLDPEENPSREGRYRFTLAHEGGGHWRLHQHLIVQNTAQTSFLDAASEPKFICRSSEAKERVEWQADFYASCLLMPRKMVFAAWDEFFLDRKQRVLQPETPVAHSFVEIPRIHASVGDFDISETENEALERFCKPLAARFLVSPIAMRIRLEKLGLLHRVVPLQRHLSGS